MLAMDRTPMSIARPVTARSGDLTVTDSLAALDSCRLMGLRKLYLEFGENLNTIS